MSTIESRGASDGATPAGRAGAGHGSLIKVVSLIGIIVGLFLVMRTLPIAPAVAKLESAVEALGFTGVLLFGVVYVVAAVAFVPGSALTLAAGAIFGLLGGFAVVSLSSITAAAISFLIARHLARSAVHQMAAGSPTFAAVDAAIGEGGWRIVAMLRLVPVFPFSAGNYLLGLTPIPFRHYVLASWIGMMPGTFLYVYFGHVGRAGLDAAAGTRERSPLEWALVVVGLLAALAVTVLITKLVRRKLSEHLAAPMASHAAAPGAASDVGHVGHVGDAEAPHGGATASASPADAGRGSRRTRPLALGAGLVLAAGIAATLRPTWAEGVLARWGGPPTVMLMEAYAERGDGASFDHSLFDRLLRAHVDAGDGGGWVDYDALEREGRDELKAYLAALAAADLESLSRDERLALLINAYNACTLELILEHRGSAPAGEDAGGDAKKGKRLASIRDIPASKRWSDRRWTIGGNVWSLDQIEHEQIRPRFREPRIHWAVVCAAVGCPPLRSEAYTGAALERQLADQARIVHSHPRWFRLEPDGVVRLTRLYEWYGNDFVQVDGSVLEHAARHAPSGSGSLRAILDAGTTPTVRFLDYDWALNSRENRPAAPSSTTEKEPRS